MTVYYMYELRFKCIIRHKHSSASVQHYPVRDHWGPLRVASLGSPAASPPLSTQFGVDCGGRGVEKLSRLQRIPGHSARRWDRGRVVKSELWRL